MALGFLKSWVSKRVKIYEPLFIDLGWVGLWGFLCWAPSAKRKDHHGVSSGWSSVWHRSNTGLSIVHSIRLEGPEDPHIRNSRFRRSHDPAHASIPLAQTPWGLTGRAWLQAGAQWVIIVVLLPLNSLGNDSCNDMSKALLYLGFGHFRWLPSFLSITFWRAFG